MMSEFWVFFKIGLFHVLHLGGYDHILFLIALTAPYVTKDWKRILILVSLFTLGHTLSLLLAVFNIIAVKISIVELLILLTILITAFYNLFTAGKSSKGNTIPFIGLLTFFFGTIHGLGFSSYFKSILSGEAIDKLPKLMEFSLGIETAQIVVVIAMMVLSFIFQTLFRFNKRDFALIMSAFVIGVIVPLVVENPIWKN